MIDLQLLLMTVMVIYFYYLDNKNNFSREIKKAGYGVALITVIFWLWELYPLILTYI